MVADSQSLGAVERHLPMHNLVAQTSPRVRHWRSEQPSVHPRFTHLGVADSTEALLVEMAPQTGSNTAIHGRSIWPQRGVLGPKVVIFGEPFAIELDEDLGVVLTHRTWSLMGYGDSLPAAEAMLWEYAKDLAHAMKDDSPVEYTEDGNRLREFVLQFLYLKSS